MHAVKAFCHVIWALSDTVNAFIWSGFVFSDVIRTLIHFVKAF